jgi:hypothetical protein
MNTHVAFDPRSETMAPLQGLSKASGEDWFKGAWKTGMLLEAAASR